jgi:hypothetical protein
MRLAQEVDLARKAAIGRGGDVELRVSSLHQQIKSKQSEIQVSSNAPELHPLN